MGLPEIHVRLPGDGTGSVAVNGQDVPGVLAVRVEGRARALPQVTLQLQGAVEVEGYGTIGVDQPEVEIDLPRELDAMLADIDPDTLDREILEGAGLGDVGGGAAEYLEAIRRYVRGD